MIKVDGTPESVPMYPYEIATRLSDLGKLDYSAQPVPGATREDFDPLERDRLRKIISTYRSSDRNLLELSDEDLEKSLRLAVSADGNVTPTLTGLLLIGSEESLQRLVPTSEAAFQVLVGTDIKVNNTYRGPLLKTIEQIAESFAPWNPGTELTVGLFSSVVPEFDERAFREALVNAFGHRDYSVLGRVRVLVDDAGLTIANPGGFVEGINVHNLLTAEPHGRNPCLMDALKRTGLAERTGRGIDRIFEGALNYGRPCLTIRDPTGGVFRCCCLGARLTRRLWNYWPRNASVAASQCRLTVCLFWISSSERDVVALARCQSP